MTFETIKPRIRYEDGHWSCQGLGKEGHGRQPKGAYMDWLSEAGLFPYC